MKITYDYHMHTVMKHTKHAKNTVEEMVSAAEKLELKGIAITNHGLGHSNYGMREENMDEIYGEILEARKKHPNIKILFGVEANLLSLDGDTDISDKIKEKCDIILCGYHYDVKYKNFNDFWHFVVLNSIAKVFGFMIKSVRKKNTRAVCQAMRKYNINILTHPGDKIFVDMDEIAKTAVETNTVLEINNRHDHLSLKEIEICKKYDVRYSIGSDAHDCKAVGCVDSSFDRIEKSGLDVDKIINVVD